MKTRKQYRGVAGRMTLFIAHGDSDRKAAESLGRFLKKRTQAIQITDDANVAQRASGRDQLVILWSKGLSNSTKGLAFARLVEQNGQRANLVVVDLDGTFEAEDDNSSPVVDARSAGLRESRSWREVSRLVNGGLSVGDLEIVTSFSGVPGSNSAVLKKPVATAAPQFDVTPVGLDELDAVPEPVAVEVVSRDTDASIDEELFDAMPASVATSDVDESIDEKAPPAKHRTQYLVSYIVLIALIAVMAGTFLFIGPDLPF